MFVCCISVIVCYISEVFFWHGSNAPIVWFCILGKQAIVIACTYFCGSNMSICLFDLLTWRSDNLSRCLNLLSLFNMLFCRYLLLSWGSIIWSRCLNVLSWGNMSLCRSLILSFGSTILSHCLNVLFEATCYHVVAWSYLVAAPYKAVASTYYLEATCYYVIAWSYLVAALYWVVVSMYIAWSSMLL